jgi:DNA-binding LytR/AlgR family response regulator
LEGNGGFGTLTIELRDSAQLADLVSALGRMERSPSMSLAQDRVAVRTPHDDAHHLIGRATILYGKAIGDYVRIVSDEGRFLVRGRISQMESRWRRHGFIRTHRAYVVNGARVDEVRANGNGTASLRLESGERVPVSRRRLAEVRAILTS